MRVDRYLDTVRAVIDRYGWAVQGVFDPDGDDPPWVYTVGLTGRDLPELLLPLGNGVPPAVGGTGGLPSLAPLSHERRIRAGQNLLNLLARHAVDVEALHVGMAYRPIAGSNTAVGVSEQRLQQRAGCTAKIAYRIYGDRVRVLTVVPMVTGDDT